jgi:hypothetical protein
LGEKIGWMKSLGMVPRNQMGTNKKAGRAEHQHSRKDVWMIWGFRHVFFSKIGRFRAKLREAE